MELIMCDRENSGYDDENDGGMQYQQTVAGEEYQEWLADKKAQAEYQAYLDELSKGEQNGMERNGR